MANEGIELLVYKYDDYSTLYGYLPSALAPKFLEELTGLGTNGGEGGGSLSITTDDPEIVANPELVAERNLIKVSVDGQVVGGWVIKDLITELITEDEYSGTVYTFSGQSVRILFNDARVNPYGGFRANSKNKRAFNFASERGDWFNEDDWDEPWIVSPLPSPLSENPTDWPDVAGSAAKWVWGASYSTTAPEGVCYFRYEWNTTSNQSYTLYIAADDNFVVYVDGQKIASSDVTGSAYESVSKVDIGVLPAGDHILAIKGIQNHGGAAGIKASLVRTTSGTNTVVTYTGDNDWLALAYPTIEPSWSIGEVLLTLLAEADDRGVRVGSYFTPTFSTTEDSNGEPWGDGYAWEFDISKTTLLDVIKALEAYCYIWVDVDTWEIHAALERGVDRTELTPGTLEPVMLLKGHNLLTATIESRDEVVNAIAMKSTDGGWAVELGTDTNSISKYGIVEGFLDVGLPEENTRAIGHAILNRKANPEQGSTYSLSPTGDNDVPWVHFNVGDWVLAPDSKGDPTPRRVVSISVERGEVGQPIYTVEFDTIWQDNEYNLNQAVAGLGGNGLGGGVLAGGSSGGGDPVVIPPSIPISTPRIPEKVTGVTATAVGYWPLDGVSPRGKLEISWDAVTLDVNGDALTPHHYEVWGIPTGGSYSLIGTTSATSIDIFGLEIGPEWDIRVRALSEESGGRGAYSDEVTDVEIPLPVTPVPTPSAPILTSSRGNIYIGWDGLDDEGDPMPPEFRYVYALLSDDGGSTWSIGPTLLKPGTVPYSAAVNDTYEVVLRAVNGANIESDDSESDTVTCVGIGVVDFTSVVASILSEPLIETNPGEALGVKLYAGGIVAYDTTGEPTIVIDSSDGSIYFKNGVVDGNALIDGTLNASKIETGSALVDLIQSISGDLNLASNNSINLVVGEAIDPLSSSISELSGNVVQMQTVFQVLPDGALISSPGEPMKLRLSAGAIEILANDTVVSSWTANQFMVNSIVVLEGLLGNHSIRKYAEVGTVIRAL